MKIKLHHSNPHILLHCRHLSCHTLNCNCGKIYAYAFLCFATPSVVGFEMNYDVNVCLCSFGLHRSRPCLCIIGYPLFVLGLSAPLPSDLNMSAQAIDVSSCLNVDSSGGPSCGALSLFSKQLIHRGSISDGIPSC